MCLAGARRAAPRRGPTPNKIRRKRESQSKLNVTDVTEIDPHTMRHAPHRMRIPRSRSTPPRPLGLDPGHVHLATHRCSPTQAFVRLPVHSHMTHASYRHPGIGRLQRSRSRPLTTSHSHSHALAPPTCTSSVRPERARHHISTFNLATCACTAFTQPPTRSLTPRPPLTLISGRRAARRLPIERARRTARRRRTSASQACASSGE